MRKIFNLFYERVPWMCIPRWWHGLAYYDYRRDQAITVIVPFHKAVNLAWWLNDKYCKWRMQPSWIDRHTMRAIQAELELTARQSDKEV